jgi:hypothetical protein
VHTTGFIPLHAPDWHESVCVQASPSLHDVPSGKLGFEHAPVPGSHVPAAWHWSLAVHTTGFPPLHTPVWHESVCVQASASSHAVPSGDAGSEHTPVAGSQVPASWHWSLAVHTTGSAPVHTPA